MSSSLGRTHEFDWNDSTNMSMLPPGPLLHTPEEERIYTASQVKLMWQRFRRHRVAMAAAAVVIVLYSLAAGLPLQLKPSNRSGGDSAG